MLCLLLGSVPAMGAVAQPVVVAATTTAGKDLTQQLQVKLAEVTAELGLTAGFDQNATNAPPGATPAEFHEYRLALQVLVRTYRKHLEDLAALEAAREGQKDLEQEIKTWHGFPDSPPYSALFVDELRDSLRALEAKEATMVSSAEILKRVESGAREGMQSAEIQLRGLEEQLEKGKPGADMVRATWLRTLAQARQRAAAANVASVEIRQRRNEIDLAGCRQELAFLQRKVVVATQNVEFSQAELDRVLSALDDRLRTLEAEYSAAESQNTERQRDLAGIRERLQKALASGADPGTGRDGSGGEVGKLQEQVKVSTVQAETAAETVRTIGQLMDFLVSERGLWQLRFNAFGTTDPTLIQNASRKLEQLGGLVQMGKTYYSQRVELAAGQIAEQQGRLQNKVQGEAALAATRALLDSYRQREQLSRRALRSLEASDRLIQRWKESFDQERRDLPWTGRVRDLFSSFSSFARNLWAFELYVAEDTITVDGQQITGRRGVTVGKILMAVCILVVGCLLARLVSRSVEKSMVARFQLDPNQANLIRRWAMVVFVMGLIVFSLVSVKIPLTIFAFAGGALAIGLGFGTQNLLKNFISGIIILFERPFRIGDVLDIDGRIGKVVAIGIRSSVLRLWDSTETLIPNSALLEGNVTNWTYTDYKVRFSVKVGVAYGSDTRRVAQMLAEIAERHGLVQKDPPPQVLLQDFGDNAITFEMRYWVDVQQHNAAQIGSDLRHMIAVVFADHKISIAFPQRDLHLDTLRPLQIEIVQRAPASNSSDTQTPPPSQAG